MSQNQPMTVKDIIQKYEEISSNEIESRESRDAAKQVAEALRFAINHIGMAREIAAQGFYNSGYMTYAKEEALYHAAMRDLGYESTYP